MEDKVIHFGAFVHWGRLRRGENLKEFAAMVGITEKRVWDIEQMPVPKVYDSTKAKIAIALGYDPEGFDSVWKSTPVLVPDPSPTQPAPEQSPPLRLTPQSLQQEIPGIQRGDEPLRHGPSATPRRKKTDPGVGIIPQTIKIIGSEGEDLPHYGKVSAAELAQAFSQHRGGLLRFTAAVQGDCMLPEFRDGEIVTFEIKGKLVGSVTYDKPYFIEFNSGECTFKTIVPDSTNPKQIILRPTNKSFADRHVKWDDLKLAARAVAKTIG